MFRKVQHLESNVNQSKYTKKFIDVKTEVNGNKEVLDTEAQDYLEALRKKLELTVDTKVQASLTTEWSLSKGINSNDNKEYLIDFGQRFLTTMKRSIKHFLNRKKQFIARPLLQELSIHANAIQQRSHVFQGCGETLACIKTYVFSVTKKVLVIQGESGCGKTTLLAHVATKINAWLTSGSRINQPYPFIVIRLLGQYYIIR